MNPARPCAFFLILFLSINLLSAQSKLYGDTVRLDLKAAEKRFVDQNLDLLIAKSQIEQSKAQLLQSKLWDNPEVDLDRELYNTGNKKFLSHNSNTQFNLQYSQLITTAGKYFKQIQINKQNVKLSEFEFYDQMRQLKQALRQNFYMLNEYQQKLEVLQGGGLELNKLVEAVTVQVNNGNVARKELVRLQSLVINYASDKTDLENQIAQTEADLKQLLNYSGTEYLLPVPDSADALPSKIAGLTFDSLQATAQSNRYDLLAANLQTDIGKNSWQLEKMRGAPDFHMGVSYDRLGSAFQDYIGLTVGVPLPLWNFNQGNIKGAKLQYEQTLLEQQSKQMEVHNSLLSAYVQLVNDSKLYQSVSKEFYSSFNGIYENVNESYRRRTIGLVEFLDYFESFKATKFNLIEIQTHLLQQAGQLNFETGKDVL